MRLLIIALVLILAPATTTAASLRLSISLASYHTQAWARDSLNQTNPGVGFEWRESRSWAVMVGAYRNSYERTTTYALAQWMPLQLGERDSWHVDGGIVGGIATGYTRTENPGAPLIGALALRLAMPRNRYDVMLVGVPNTGAGQSGFIGLQVSVAAFR